MLESQVETQLKKVVCTVPEAPETGKADVRCPKHPRRDMGSQQRTLMGKTVQLCTIDLVPALATEGSTPQAGTALGENDN